MERHFILSQNQQHDLEVKIETQKSHRRHFETRLRELQGSIRKAEREHAAMIKLVQVSVVVQCFHFYLRLKKKLLKNLPQPQLFFIFEVKLTKD